MRDFSTRFLVSTACCLFLLLGAALIPYAGVQNDEALFAGPLYSSLFNNLRTRIFHHYITLMVMSYVGTLKTLLYVPIFRAFGVNVWAVRLPMVIAGAITIFFFFNLARRSAGAPVAVLASWLLATDPIFLLTNTFDWGPVTLQLFLIVTGCFFLVRFGQATVSTRMSKWDVSLGFFCLGLALWNKAIVVWALAGLLCGGLAVFWPEIRRAWGFRNLSRAVVFFALGALPFIIFNIKYRNASFASNAHFERANFQTKFLTLRGSLNGERLLGFLPADETADNPKTPSSLRGGGAAWIRARLGPQRRNGMDYAMGLAILAVPLWWRSRAARFSLVFMVVAWTTMVFTRDAGGSVHHAVLLWPFPHLFLAATLASLRSSRVLALAGIGLVTMNLLVVNQYVYQFERDGAEGNFTDALFPLSDALPDPPGNTAGQPIYVIDWGMLNTLILFHQGRLQLRAGEDLLATDAPSLAQQAQIAAMLSDPNAVFVGHVPAREVIAGVGEHLDAAAQARGYLKEPIRIIADSNGRPVFEIFRFHR